MNHEWKKINQFLKEANPLLIASHVDPDGDALGSTLAMAHVCKQFGKSVVCVNESPIPKRFSFLPHIDEVLLPDQITGTFQYVITVDAADQSRVGSRVQQCFDSDVSLLNIDHHATNDQFGTVNVIESNASSTTEILFRWINESVVDVKWDHQLSTYLYTGILTDTGGFRYSNTTSEVLRIAAHLIDQGVNPHEIADQALETSTYEQLLCLQKALSTLQLSPDGQIAWLSLALADLKQLNATDADMGGIVDEARKIRGVDAGVFFREVSESTVKVSLRSRKKVNVAKVAQAFGGGGHPRAAGCTVKGQLEDVKQKVIQRLKVELERV